MGMGLGLGGRYAGTTAVDAVSLFSNDLFAYLVDTRTLCKREYSDDLCHSFSSRFCRHLPSVRSKKRSNAGRIAFQRRSETFTILASRTSSPSSGAPLFRHVTNKILQYAPNSSADKSSVSPRSASVNTGIEGNFATTFSRRQIAPNDAYRFW